MKKTDMKYNNNLGDNKSEKTGVILGKNMSFELSEAFKLLRTNISFSLPDDEECRVIGIVGAVRGVGKSFVAANLAYSFANANKKVLLIDADLRMPTVALKTGLAPTPGLSNYLAGVGADSVESIVQNFAPSLDVITAGNIPPNPSELLGSEKMRGLLRELKERYDYIIFDLPPAVVVSDALVVSKLVHGFLLVVRQKIDEKKSVHEMMRQFELVDAKVLGFVFNAYDTGTRRYDKYKKYRYYRYYKREQ